jgi:CubicO group peptidase (beta-lactamase class C family)
MRLFAFVLAVATLAVVLPAQAAARFPGTPAGRAAATLIETFDTRDPATFRDYLAERWPGSRLPPDEFRERRAQSGGYDLVEVERETDTTLSAVLKTRLADDYLRLQLEVEAGADPHIRSLSLAPMPRPPDVAPPVRIGATALKPLVDAQLAAMGDFSGAVLVVQDGRTVYARAAGLANREHQTSNTLETRFRIASMGKMFTAVAILQLAQAGKLDLDATVGTYLPDYPNATFAKTVTIAQLLSHTGGAGDFMGPVWAARAASLKAPADYVALFGGRPPEFTPGSRFSYANYGFIVLGRIVERVSGEAYGDYLAGHVFGPAGMSHSGLDVRPDVAGAYVRGPDGLRPRPAAFDQPGTPAGGGYSTVGDLQAFAQALTAHRLLDADHTRQMLTGRVNADGGLYGYGVQDRSAGGLRDVGHDGGGPGENGSLRILADGQAVIVVLTNVAPTWRGDKLAAFIAARLRTRDWGAGYAARRARRSARNCRSATSRAPAACTSSSARPTPVGWAQPTIGAITLSIAQATLRPTRVQTTARDRLARLASQASSRA